MFDYEDESEDYFPETESDIYSRELIARPIFHRNHMMGFIEDAHIYILEDNKTIMQFVVDSADAAHEMSFTFPTTLVMTDRNKWGWRYTTSSIKYCLLNGWNTIDRMYQE